MNDVSLISEPFSPIRISTQSWTVRLIECHCGTWMDDRRPPTIALSCIPLTKTLPPALFTSYFLNEWTQSVNCLVLYFTHSMWLGVHHFSLLPLNEGNLINFSVELSNWRLKAFISCKLHKRTPLLFTKESSATMSPIASIAWNRCSFCFRIWAREGEAWSKIVRASKNMAIRCQCHAIQWHQIEPRLTVN